MDEIDRVCTGVAGLDTQLGGGVPPGTSILLIAESTNALYQFLDEMAAFGTSQGEQILWFELDRPLSILERSLDGTVDDNRENLTILDAYEADPARAGRNGASGYQVERADPHVIPDLVTERLGRVEPGNYRLMLSSLSTLLQDRDPDEVRAFLRQVVAMGEDLGGLQIFSLVKDAHPPDVVAMLKHSCTAVFELGMERKGFGLYSYLKIVKLLGVPDSAKIMLFNETDEGLRLESTQRVF
jgi:KaiC/GvpD/RAD55 family RecA-like ATPase